MKLSSEAAICSAPGAFPAARRHLPASPNVVEAHAGHTRCHSSDLIAKLQSRSRLSCRYWAMALSKKPYLHVAELVDAMLFVVDHANDRLNTFNVGPDDSGCRVDFIAQAIRDRVSPKAEITYGRERRGWTGDVPQVRYDVGKLTRLGWTAKMSSRNSPSDLSKAVDEIAVEQLGEWPGCRRSSSCFGGKGTRV